MDVQNMSQSADFYAFLDERYEPDYDSGAFRCKRCGEIVDWVTKHAAEKHGDDIEVLPKLNQAAQGRW